MGAVTGIGNDGIALFSGGGITNQAGGTVSGKYDGVLIKFGAGTVTNAGTILGATAAVALPAGFANQVIVDPGAVFSGLVDGGNTIGVTVTSTLELASAAAPGLISGLGTQFINFAQTTIDTTAQWTLTDANTLVAGTTFTNTGALTILNGGLVDAGTIINNGVIQENAATLTTATLDGTGTVVIGGGSSLTVTGSVAATQTIVFAGNGVLDIASSATAAFAGQLVLANGAKVVSHSASDTVSGIAPQSASVAVNGTGATWASAGQLQVGASGLGEFAIQAGATATVGAGAVIAGPASASGSAINLSGAASSLQITGLLDVGVAGFGGLSLIGGASVTADSLDVGNSASGVGQISVSGAGSSLAIAGAATIADDGTGVLSVLNGANFSATSLAIGTQGTSSVFPSVAGPAALAVAGASGIVSVIGTGSNLTMTGQLTIGDSASAELSILSGAMVAANNADIGLNAGSTGNVDIEGAGSHLDIANDLNIGDAGVGVLTLGNGTELTVGNNLVVGANGVLNQFGGSIDPSTITIVSGGRQGGHGTSTASVMISNAGTLFASGGTETVITPLITAPSGKSGVLEVDAGGDMLLNVTSVDATQSVSFTDGTGILTIGTIGGFSASIVTVNPGDQIIVQGKSIASDSFNASSHVLTLFDGSSATIGTLQLGPSVDGSAILANGTGGLGVAPCFAAGTRISTERGEVAVEDLRVGDRVQIVPRHPHASPLPLRGRGGAVIAVEGPLLPLRQSGGGLRWGSAQPITWIGHRTVDCTRHPKPHQVHPVRISAHAFGPNRPCRDLYLSPDHALYINDVLIPVKHLINGNSIAQVARNEVSYYHIELPAHEVLLAEKLPAESYLDTGDRANFANSPGPVALHPDFASRRWEAEGCAPLVVAGPEVDAVRRWIGYSAEAGTRVLVRCIGIPAEIGVGQHPPGTAGQHLGRAEARLVRHLPALRHPIAEIHVGQAQRQGALDQPQDRIGAERLLLQPRREEAVDRGQAVSKLVGQARADHAVVGIAELHDEGLDRRVLHHGAVVVEAHGGHVAVAVAGLLVALEQLELLRGGARGDLEAFQQRIGAGDAAQRAVGLEGWRPGCGSARRPGRMGRPAHRRCCGCVGTRHATAGRAGRRRRDR